MLVCHLGDEQYAHRLPQFRDTVSPCRHEQQSYIQVDVSATLLCLCYVSVVIPPACPFPGGKALLGRDAGHSPPSSDEVKNEKELYFLSPLALAWR
jgi:hypothetical protein